MSGPTPGWVISSLAPRRWSACSFTRWFSFSMSDSNFT